MEKYLIEKHYPHLDGLRGIAIMLVLLIHLYSISIGWIGVDLFFVLSGFLITNILFSYENSYNSYMVFMIRRGLRIFPLYFLSLILIFIVGENLFIEYIPDFQVLSDNKIYFWTYTQNFFLSLDIVKPSTLNHFWSLAIEEQFYLIWPLIILKFKHNTRILLLAFLALILISVVLKLSSDNIAVNYTLLPFRMDSLILGATISLVLKDSIQINCKIIQLLFFIIILTFISIVFWEGSLSHTSLWMSKIGYFTIDLFFAGLLLISLKRTKTGQTIRGMLSNKLFIFFGKYSYGIYVIHWPLKHLIWKSKVLSDFKYGLLINSIILILCVVLAYIIFHLFETKFLRLKNKFEAVKVNS